MLLFRTNGCHLFPINSKRFTTIIRLRFIQKRINHFYLPGKQGPAGEFEFLFNGFEPFAECATAYAVFDGYFFLCFDKLAHDFFFLSITHCFSACFTVVFYSTCCFTFRLFALGGGWFSCGIICY